MTPEVTMFADEQIKLLADSGWNTCDSVREGIEEAGLPVPTAKYLKKAFTAEQWKRAHRATDALSAHFANARFADTATYGVLLVPDPDKLDTRGAVDKAIRRDQTKKGAADVVDRDLPAGRLVIHSGTDWTLLVTITSRAGIHLGGYNEIRNDDAETYLVGGVDTRDLMVRQIWGARLLQSGSDLPDCETTGAWTFTLFPGEETTNGRAASGTVLYDKVRFRLGNPNRDIAVVRVCPALVIS
jgi:hypothetical protein